MSMVRGIVSRLTRGGGGRGSMGGAPGGPHPSPMRGGHGGGSRPQNEAVGRGVRSLLRRFR